MKAFKNNKVLSGCVVLFLLVCGLILIPADGIAQEPTQGDVALQMAGMLGFPAATAEEAIAALVAAGVVPAGGWNSSAPATSGFIGSLYTATNNAIAQGTITPPAGLGNASALVSAAGTAAGMPSSTAVGAVVGAGGDQTSANLGATFGTAAAAAGTGGPGSGPRGPSFGPGPGGGDAGGGGGSPSS